MHKSFTTALACTIALATSPSSRAGEHQRKLVAIWEHGGAFTIASGNAGDVFNSQGAVETIWCKVVGVETAVLGYCFARDEKGRTLQCHTWDEPIIRPMLAMNGDSTISFMIGIRDEGNAECDRVDVTNGSYAAPKRQTTPETDDSAIDTTGVMDEVQ